jgi:hypothetical protein
LEKLFDLNELLIKQNILKKSLDSKSIEIENFKNKNQFEKKKISY